MSEPSFDPYKTPASETANSLAATHQVSDNQPPPKYSVLAYIPAAIIGSLLAATALDGTHETLATLTESPSYAVVGLLVMSVGYFALSFLYRKPRQKCSCLTKYQPTRLASFIGGFVANAADTVTFEVFCRLGILNYGGPRTDNEFGIFAFEVATFLIIGVEIEAWISCKSQGLHYFTSTKEQNYPSNSHP